MTCARPVVFRVGSSPTLHRVPCGHCRPCRIARAREWTTRMLCELEQWRASCFVTLTYDDEHLPEGGTLVPWDSERWIKRVRKAIEPRLLRFYLVGDYGTPADEVPLPFKGDRPHYHAILFGADYVSDGPMLKASWSYGFTCLGSVTEHSIRYVADYVQKKVYGVAADLKYQDRVPPYSRMSQGLGRDWCDARAEQLRADLSMQHRGKAVALPRYFARRLGITEADTLEQRVEHGLEVMRHHNERNSRQFGPWYDWPSVQASNAQNGVDAEAKARVARKGKI